MLITSNHEQQYIVLKLLNMSPVHCFEFLVFSFCIQSFSIFTYLYYYADFAAKSLTQELKYEYDYIIVGSGTAGSLIAHRLAVETNYSFIVLEAGGGSHNFHDVPAFAPLLHVSVYDWGYETVSQAHACYAMERKKCKQTQGKIFGGSAKLNNMIHARSNLSHYADWFHGKYTIKDLEYHFAQTEKMFQLSDIQYQSKFSESVLKAAKELGYDEINDFNVGFMRPKYTQKRGKRWTPAQKVSAHHIRTNVLVEKLLIRNNKCFGVQISGKKVYAAKGIIVSAGTFNSAKILQLSGIGPAELLKSLGIPVIMDLPVGRNLQDHVGTGLDLILFDTQQLVGMWEIMHPMSVYNYFAHGNGPMTTPGCELIGFLSTKNTSTPDIQFMVLPVGISADRDSHLRKSLRINDRTWHNYYSRLYNKYAATILPLLLHPKSKGEVKIQSKDPKVPPLIDPNYLAETDDVRTLIEGLKLVKKFVETKSMKDLGAKLNTLPFPGCEHYKFYSDEYLECYIRHLTLTSYHSVGTCSMSSDSKHAVVDTSFKVFGVDNLYVVDASVLPTLPSANINAAIALMANLFFEDAIKRKSDNLYCNANPFPQEIDKCWPS
ncbi:glucose dehydrogenase [FAD, quinone]-like [Aricia agestis]|uniref:glucose dehydrogenase [FAD, quinone]-like n=1 Tax=Aricia agestis TaxID=91739 RepID=UPI001C205BCC|nr:glucose dehydrogenase [FAD, quinone]-like [Aricia agestis]